MDSSIFIPQPTDMVTPAMNLYKLMQQKKEFELEQQKQGSLQDYHKQMNLQNKIQNIISLSKDQPKAAEQMFNSDPEMVQRNQGPIKFKGAEGDWHIYEGGDSVYKINRKSGVLEKAKVGGADIAPKGDTEKTDHYTLKNTATGEIKSVRLSSNEVVPKGWEIVYAPTVSIIPTSEGFEAIRAERGSGGTTITTESTGKNKPLTGEMVTTEQQFGTLRDGLDVVKKLYKRDYVGPVEGRTGSVKEKTVGLNPNQATFYASLEGVKNALIYALSGKQINESEYNRLLKQLPDRNLPDKVFDARLQEFERVLDSVIEERHKAMGGYGIPAEQPKGDNKSKAKDVKQMSDKELEEELYK